MEQKAELFNVNLEQFSQIIDAQLDLNTTYLLEMYLKGIDPLSVTKSLKVSGWRATLIRKGYLTEDNEVTLQGKDYYTALLSNSGKTAEVVKIRKNQIESDFESWWSIFPPTDAFTYKGVNFKGERGLRIHKLKCKETFCKLVNSGEYTAIQIIEATKADVSTRKEASVKLRENKLKYLQNSSTYLNQRSFDPYVDQLPPAPDPGNSSRLVSI